MSRYEARFNELMAELKNDFWDDNPVWLAKTLRKAGLLNVQNTLNTLNKEQMRTTPPTRQETTAVELTLFDNWPNGKRPKEGEEGHDRARWKMTVEVWNQPEPEPIWGKSGNKSGNSVYKGTAILMDEKQMTAYLKDKRAGRNTKEAWDSGDMAVLADRLEVLVSGGALVGPLIWGANRKSFSKGMMVVVENVGTDQMSATVCFADDGILELGATSKAGLPLWTTTTTKGKPLAGNIVSQCRATSRSDYSSWRTAKF